MLYIKKRDPFVRQPSSEAMARAGVPVAQFPMATMTRRRSSADTLGTATSSLRPLSMAGSARGLQVDTEAQIEPPRSRLRATLEDGALAAAEKAGIAYRWAEPKARELALPAAVAGLTLWCVVLTVYVAKDHKAIRALANVPLCEDIGLHYGISQAPGLVLEG